MDFKKFSDNLVSRPSVHVAAWYMAAWILFSICDTAVVYGYFGLYQLGFSPENTNIETVHGMVALFYIVITMAFSIILLIIFTIENIKKWRIKNDLSPKLYKLVKFTTLFFFSLYLSAIIPSVAFITRGIIEIISETIL